jgi:hypothetical protein
VSAVAKLYNAPKPPAPQGAPTATGSTSVSESAGEKK